MSNEPLNLQCAICLRVESELDASVVKSWFTCVRDNAPEGVVMSIVNIDDKGNPNSVSMVHREAKKGHYYLVPLSRNLNEDEAEKIIDVFADENAELDFDISISSNAPEPFAVDTGNIDVQHEQYLSLCVAWAKRQHEDWMRERAEQGWTYGTSFSLKNKTHPLLRPWSELPEHNKKVNLKDPQTLVDLLNDQGYMVISKGELEGIMKLIRSTLY